jgi:hypothetical protein
LDPLRRFHEVALIINEPHKVLRVFCIRVLSSYCLHDVSHHCKLSKLW